MCDSLPDRDDFADQKTEGSDEKRFFMLLIDNTNSIQSSKIHFYIMLPSTPKSP
jgi:hypothetical protein